ENGLGWQVELWNATGTTRVKTTTAAADGSYDFTGLDPATHQAKEVLQGPYVQTSPTSSTTALPFNVTVRATSTPPTSGYSGSYSVQVMAGFSDQGLNFGNRLEGDLSITKTDNKGGTFSPTTNNTDGGSAQPGTSVTYTITVSNSGPSTATSVAV